MAYKSSGRRGGIIGRQWRDYFGPDNLLLFLSLETGKGVYLPLSPLRGLSATGRVDPLGEPPNLGRGPSGLRRTIQHGRNLTGIELTESLVRRHTLPLPLCPQIPFSVYSLSSI